MKILTLKFRNETETQAILDLQDQLKRTDGVVSTEFHVERHCQIAFHRELRAQGVRKCPVCNLYVGAEILRRGS